MAYVDVRLVSRLSLQETCNNVLISSIPGSNRKAGVLKFAPVRS